MYMYYYYRSSYCFDGGDSGHYSHVAEVETEISDLLAWGHTARNGRARKVNADKVPARMQVSSRMMQGMQEAKFI